MYGKGKPGSFLLATMSALVTPLGGGAVPICGAAAGAAAGGGADATSGCTMFAGVIVAGPVRKNAGAPATDVS